MRDANDGGDNDTQLATFWEISNLSKDESNGKELVNPKLGLLAMLAKTIIEDTSGDSRVAAIGVLWNLSVSADNRVEIINPEVGLVSALVKVLNSDDEKLEAKNRSLGVLHNVSLSQDAQPKLGETASDTGLLRALINLLMAPQSEEAEGLRDRALGVLWNLSTCGANRTVVAAQDGLVASLADMLLDARDNIAGKALIIVYV